MAGAGPRSAASSAVARWLLTVSPAIVLLLLAGPGSAQSLYKYRGTDGEWIFADRPPQDGSADEVRSLKTVPGKGVFKVSATDAGAYVRFTADNSYYVPIEIRVRFNRFENLVKPENFEDLRWVVPPQNPFELIRIEKVAGLTPAIEFQYDYITGDPRAEHRPAEPYRVPYASATRFPITQAYPDVVTHGAPNSRYAVDIAMPIGTDIFAARGGVVFDVSSDNYEGGLDPVRDGPSANVVQILHDDGTYAVYAHLNWNSIRVRPGDRVARGQYIADSGNTGFSSGPHLHFAVLRNVGMRTESVPIQFQGANYSAIVPRSGVELTAY